MGVVPLDITPADFDELVETALDEIPAVLAERVHNVIVLVEDVPPADQPADLLGLYEGVALTEQEGGNLARLPDRILVFRRPLLALCSTQEELVAEVRTTVVHELGHHFGLDEDRLHELGWA